MKCHIVYLGDSNTHGYYADPADCADDSLCRLNGPEQRTCRLQATLGKDFLILEEGLPERTTAFDDPVGESLSTLPYLYPCLISHASVSLLVVTLGTNDTREWLGVNACAIGKDLRHLVRKAQSIDCWAGGQPNLLIVAPPTIGKGVERSPVAQKMGLGYVGRSLHLPGQFRMVAAKTRCHFLDANALDLAHNPIDFMYLIRESHVRLATTLAKQIPTLSQTRTGPTTCRRVCDKREAPS